VPTAARAFRPKSAIPIPLTRRSAASGGKPGDLSARRTGARRSFRRVMSAIGPAGGLPATAAHPLGDPRPSVGPVSRGRLHRMPAIVDPNGPDGRPISRGDQVTCPPAPAGDTLGSSVLES
jgi:hypothetical protein